MPFIPFIRRAVSPHFKLVAQFYRFPVTCECLTRSLLEKAFSDPISGKYFWGVVDPALEAFARGRSKELVEIVVTVGLAMEAQTADTSARTCSPGSMINLVKSFNIFQRNQPVESRITMFDRAWSGLFVVVVFIVSVVIIVPQIAEHGKTVSYLLQKQTSFMLDSSYICNCSLPPHLLSLQEPPGNEISSNDVPNVKSCYTMGDLSTITVVQFNNDTAYGVAQTLNEFSPTTDISYARNENGWFFLEQDTTELVLWTDNDSGTLASICKGVPYIDTVFTFALNNPSLSVYFDYPLQYTRMAIEYNCSDCSVCSPEKIMYALGKMRSSFLLPVSQWVECSGYGAETSPNHPCKAAQSYHGRCNLYPTFDISMSTRLNQALSTLTAMSPHLIITTQTANGQPGIEMHANVLYYNRSSVAEAKNVTYGYFKIDPSTDPIWPILAAQYPNLVGSCSASYMKNYEVPVCNGTSFCNVYKELGSNGVSAPTLNCIDFSQNYSGCLLMAQASGNERIVDKLCERNSPYCEAALPYQVKYPIRDLSTTSPDKKIVSSIMNNSWLQTYTSSVCSIQYKNVVPFTLSNGRQVFLETECNSQDLCTITGNYSAVNDTADMLPRRVEEPDWNRLEPYTTPDYVCYKLTTVPWRTFLIILIGTIGGWVSNVLHIFQAPYLSSLAYDRCESLFRGITGSVQGKDDDSTMGVYRAGQSDAVSAPDS